jgi:hypothetical protein
MPRPIRWLARAIGVAAVAYAALLLFGGIALRGCVEELARERMARSLAADVSIGTSSLSIRRGRMVLEDVVARRAGGDLDLRIARVEAGVAGWGAVVFDHDLDRLRVRGLRLDLSASGLTGMPPRREPRPLPIGDLLIEDARIAIAPTAILPALGRAELTIARAHARDVQLSSAVSWMEALGELDADLSAPGGIGLAVDYSPDALSLDGRVFGIGRSIRVPFRFPHLDPAAHEIDQLRALATALIASARKALLE